MPPGYVLYIRRGALVARRFDPSANTLSGDAVTVADPVGWDGAIGIGAFSASATGVIAHRTSGPGRRQLAWFDRRGQADRCCRRARRNSLQYPALSHDGLRVATDRTVLNNRDIYLIDFARGEPTRLTFDAGIDPTPYGLRTAAGSSFVRAERASTTSTSSPRISKATRPSCTNLASDSSHPERLVARRPVLLLHATRIQRMATISGSCRSSGTRGRRKPFRFVQTPADELQAAFSPDGHWVAYQSNEGGPMEVYVQPFPGPGGKRQISNAGGASPRWRRDGRELFYLSPDAKLMAVPIRSQGPTMEPGDAQCSVPDTAERGLGRNRW